MKFHIILVASAFCLIDALSLDKVQRRQKCGTPAIKPDTSSNIIGGKDSIPHSWPWQVRIPGFNSCGATLISNQWVLTAAHCITDLDPEMYLVRLGAYNLSDTSERGRVSMELSELHVHPKYTRNWNNSWYDIALMKLKEPIEFTDHISPICLPAVQDELPLAGTNTYIIGWGNTKVPPAYAPSDTLKQVTVPLVSQAVCKAKNPSDYEFNEKVEICIGFEQGGKGACHGDSGGPAMIQNPDGSWIQIGITSWVHNGICAAPSHTVFSKVSAFLEFIRKYVKGV